MSHPKAILQSLGAAARKSLSQNFLLSPHWSERLALEALSIECDTIWEIGPGLGALTRPLLERAEVPVVLFEYDRKFAPYLRKTFPKAQLREGDFLEQDIALLAEGKNISVLSNLPYHLSSPILFRLAQLPVPPVQMVLTFQREFAQRIVAQPRTPAYGSMSVLLQLQFEIQSLGVVPPGAFYPVPEVDSEALRLKPSRTALPIGFRGLVKGAFQQRRKRLVGNLKNALPGQGVENAVKKLGLDPLVRPEELSPETYLQLGSELGLFIAEPSGSV